MPTEQDWLIPQQLVKVRFYGDLTLAEIGESFQRSAELVNSSTAQTVHFLHDWSEVTQYPTDISAIRRSLKARVKDRRKLGWVVAYGIKYNMMVLLAKIAFQLVRVQFRNFETEALALGFLRKCDPSLPDEIPTTPMPQPHDVDA